MVRDMVHDLRINTMKESVSFFCSAHVHQKSTQGAQNIVHQNFKFFEPCYSNTKFVDLIRSKLPTVKWV